MKDQYGREIDYLRISITDRCNLRCRYCIPDGVQLVPMGEILSYEEIETVCRCAAELGFSKIKITGGEPLVRKGAPELIGKIRSIPGIEHVTMTTNGILIPDYLDELVASGLEAVNISLDTLDAQEYSCITGRDQLELVKKGIRMAAESSLRTKINVVLQEGVHEQGWRPLVELARELPIDVRFIELMPIGEGAHKTGISGDVILQKVEEAYPGTVRDESVHGNGPAVYYRIPGFAGSVGFIEAIHGKFCDRCNRIRLSAEGELKPCLCYDRTIALKPFLRAGDVEGVKEALSQAVFGKPEAHCFEHRSDITENKNMVSIGG